MPTTFEQSKDDIALRVRQFAINRDAYHGPNYKEAHARQEFIDPLFAALGWDVHNAQRLAPDYREVVIEDSVDIEGQKKAPDYVFRVGRERKFFAEAKKPGVDLKKDAAPAYQLRRYAWTAKLPLSLLTDFEELATYDCRSRPSANDKPSVGRVSYFNYVEYADRWREIWDVYSREAVWGGSFDQFALSNKGKRGTSEVDTEFLKEIEGWREALARNLALRNPQLGIDELNDAVQRTIDRIIFLRLTEDRGIEDYGRMLRLAESEDIYPGLVRLFRAADAKYNSGLFDFSREGDRLTAGLSLDDKTLKPILADLYFPQSPYEFSVLPVEILGNVYEQFLGKVIRLTAAHQAKVEEKPEVKKAGGVYYTPAYIVKYIVHNTVGKMVEGKSPLQLRGLRVLDPACGSGSFLLGAYQYLLDYYLGWYTANAPEKNPRSVWQAGEAWRLTGAEKKRILTEHIFGVDIDRQAVEVTKLSLLLAVLESETGEDAGKQLALLPEQARERVLPNLDRNIKCGNSLIGPDYFAGQLLPDEAELRRVNPFDWQREFPDAMKAGGFDCVIGNPPYIRVQTLQQWAPLEVEIYKQSFVAASSGNYDIYVVFVEKGLKLLNARGRLGFILPHKFFNAKYGEALRGLIAQGKHLAGVVHFGDQQVFVGATTYTCLLFLNKAGVDELNFVKVNDLLAWRSSGQGTTGTIQTAYFTTNEWNFQVGSSTELFGRLGRMPTTLGNVARLFVGLQTDADDVYILEEVRRDKTRVLCQSKATGKKHWFEDSHVKYFLKGSLNIRRYYLSDATKRLIFPYEMREGKSLLIEPDKYAKQFPLTWAYLEENKARLTARNKGNMGQQWYGYVYKKNHTLFSLPKLLVPSIAKGSCFAADLDGAYYFVGSGGGGGGGYGITLEADSQWSYDYLLGLLNSRLLSEYLKSISTPFRGGYFALNRQYIEQIPIQPIDHSNSIDKERHDLVVGLVTQMLDLHNRLTSSDDASERERLQRIINSTDQQIDGLVYELYGLTEEEIAILEGGGEKLAKGGQ